jgi:coenzyme F420-reducing hydrogenase beta subunit
MNSSSGGAFSALAEYVIGKKGVIYGATYDSTMKVVHTKAETLEEYKKMRGSKYSQSDIIGIFEDCKKELLRGRNVLFTGTPCQIAGLNAYLHKHYEKLLTVDLICHAVPSPKIFAEYVNFVNKKYKDTLIDIAMRYKQSCGWSHSYAYKYLFKSGKSLVDPLGLINWGRIYFSGCIDRPSCSNCQFANFDRVGDITIADFWDDLLLRPDLKSKKGTSLLMINSKNGVEVAEHLYDSLQFWDITEYEALQRSLIKPSDVSLQHEKFWTIYKKEGFEGTLKKMYPIKQTALIKKYIKGMIKRFI